MGKFTTKEFIIPDSPPNSPPFGSPTLLNRRLGSSTQSNVNSTTFPALPDSLMEALAREPPPPSTNGPGSTLQPSPIINRSASLGTLGSSPMRPNNSSSLLSPSSPQATQLPAIPPQSPLNIVYPGSSRSPSPSPLRKSPSITPKSLVKSVSKASLSDRSNRLAPGASSSDTGQLLSESDAGFFSATEGDSSPVQPIKEKKSMWSFGRSKSTTRLPKMDYSSSPMTRNTSSSSADFLPPPPLPIRSHAITTDSPSRISKRNSIAGLALEEEIEQLESHIATSRAKKNVDQLAGRGIDQELDDMDFESRPSISKSTQSELRSAASPEIPSPWRSGERYTHDLTEGIDEVDSEGEEESVAEPIELDNKNSASTLYARRRLLGSPGEPPIIAVPDVPSPSALDPPNTAPLSSLGPFIDRLAEGTLRGSWSDGKLSSKVAEFGAEDQLAESLGLKGDSIASPIINAPVPTITSEADFVIAVVGPRLVGKSTVIRKGLKRPDQKPIVVIKDDKENRVTTCISHFNIGGKLRSVEVLEIDMALLKYNSAGVIWPEELPKCEGAMLCYDATDPRALDGLSLLLQAFWTRGSDTPLIVLATKASTDDSLNATNTKKAAEICNVYGAGIVALDGGIEDPNRKMKNSFNWMIRTIMDNRGEIRRDSMSISPLDSRRTSDKNEMEVIKNPKLEDPTSVTNSPELSRGGVIFGNPFGDSDVNMSPSDQLCPPEGNTSITPDSNTVEEGDLKESEKLDFPTKSNAPAPLDLHFSREDMIDKFLFASVTGNDEQYVTLFLIVYRRFSRPFDVLSKLIERFEFVAGRLKTDPLLSRFAQMKLCGVLSTWFQAYPGDFTGSSTFYILQSFLDGLLPRGATWVAHYAIELIPLLNSVSKMEDPETSWALPDESLTEPLPEPVYIARRPSLAPSYESTHSTAPSTNQVFNTMNFIPSFSDSISISSEAKGSSDASTIATVESFGWTNSLGSGMEQRRDGKVGTQMGNLLEFSNALLELPEEVIAVQITRIAWDAFSEITPRDLMRHVLTPRKSKIDSGLNRDEESNVIRSIHFVNYLADWVASMLLVQSKLKWRAKLLEKFITIAYNLRELENFDSLMGVLAGLNSQPIFRLKETIEVVNLKVEKDKSKLPKRLRSLNKLMSTTKSFAAYRLALANSGANMLPYLGVHLQDITIVNEVKSDMKLGLVNWSKFQQMGRSSAIVLDCSRLAPILPIDRGVEKCILNVPILDKDAQYALSYTYQPRNNVNVSRSGFRKLFEGMSETLASV